LHTPCRNIFIIEQNQPIILEILKSNTDLNLWVQNEWIILICRDPSQNHFYRYRKNSFEKIEIH
jgi:uncharacterized protein YbcC (UPF0753/DUF2309 family)